MKRVNKFGVILVLKRSEERREKRVFFVHTAVCHSEKLMCAKNFSKRANYFVHVRLLKAIFIQLSMVMGFDYDIVLISGLL